MPKAKKQAAPPWRQRFKKFFSKTGTMFRKLMQRLLNIAVGKPKRSPGDIPPPSAATPAASPAAAAPSAAKSDPSAAKSDPPAAVAAAAAAWAQPAAAPRAKKAPEPKTERGEWHVDHMTTLTGRVDLAPLAPPTRDFRIYEPPAIGDDAQLMVMLHGCKQTSVEIAAGTRLNEHADKHGWPVLYPEQARTANKYFCWNWFDPANLRGQGECALIVAMLEAARKRYKLGDDAPAFLAGMSAGGALASILALHFPERWAGVAIHSGLPYAAAEDPFSALRVMREGARNLSAARTLRERSATAPGVPAMIFHGNADDVVDRRNADLLVRQFLGWNGYFADGDWDDAKLPKVDDERIESVHGHPYVLRQYRRKGLAPVTECEVVGMGHAWAGGDPALPYHDEMGPDASELMLDFFASVAGSRTVVTANAA